MQGRKINIFLCDECPGPIDGGSLKGAGTQFYAGAKDPAYRIKKKCRELVTFDACFNLGTGEQVADNGPGREAEEVLEWLDSLELQQDDQME